jgi:hypothetical protein
MAADSSSTVSTLEEHLQEQAPAQPEAGGTINLPPTPSSGTEAAGSATPSTRKRMRLFPNDLALVDREQSRVPQYDGRARLAIPESYAAASLCHAR